MNGDRMPFKAHEMSQEEMRGASYPQDGTTGISVLERQRIPTVGPGPRPVDQIASLEAVSRVNRTPGPGGPLRGVEANTARSNGTEIPTYHSPNSTVEPASPDIDADADDGWR